MKLRGHGKPKTKRSTTQMPTRLIAPATKCQTHRQQKSAEEVPRPIQKRSLNASMKDVARAIPGPSIYIDTN